MPPTRSTNSPAPAEHAARAEWYAKEVVAGRIPAGKLVRLACQRQLDDLKRKGFPFKFDADLGARVCRFIETFQHTKGRWAALHQNVKLEPWQCFIIVVLFGWVRKKNGTRRFRTAYLELPRKNGKSLTAAGIGLYMLMADNEYGAEVYCLSPETAVLDGDLHWRPLSSFGVGDAIVAFDETPERPRAFRKLRWATITAHTPIRLQSFKITFEDGREVICSGEHKWLGCTAVGQNYVWKETRKIKPGFDVVDLGKPWADDNTRDAGYMAGIYDGEGWLRSTDESARRKGRNRSGYNVGFSQNPGPILDRVHRGMTERGFSPTVPTKQSAAPSCNTFEIRGTYNCLRFLGQVRPERLIGKAKSTWPGMAIGRYKKRARVVSIEPVGEVDLVAVETSTRTLFAEGLFSHNSGATTERQAHEVWRPAKLMLERNERIRKKLGASVWARALAVEANGSKFETVIGDPGDGASPSCAIVDEYHEHQTPRLYDTMETGMGARDQPLMLVITTAGTNIAGPCHEKHSEVAKVLEGTLENEELFGIVYGIDPGDRWEDPASLRKANPNFGISVDEEFLLSQQRQAMQSPVQQTKFKTKHLNVWCSVYAGVMNMQQWALCADPMLTEDELAGADCWIAVDLASKSDLCAAQRLYRKEIAGRAHYYLFGSHWLPEEAVEEPGPNHAHYVKWRNKGLLTQTDGATVDFDLITETLIEDCKRINPQEVVFDPFNAVQMMQAVMRQNITAVEFIQTPQNFAVPLDELLSAVKDGRFHHDGNEITTWCVSNMVARPAKKGLVAPIKQKPHQKIDSAIAICMCMARASTAPTEQPYYQMLFV